MAEYINIYKEITKCVQCLACDSVCPVYIKTKNMSFRPSRILVIARYLLNPQLIYEMNQSLIVETTTFINSCIKCNACQTICPIKIDIPYIINKLSEA